MSLTGSAESNELDSEAGQMSPEALYENTVSDSLNLNLNPSQFRQTNRCNDTFSAFGNISDSSDFHENVALDPSQVS
ncbi:hypothetical protein F8M41_011998 [Gigaspora margarita]|uniref:Uncharacterized protein n=1 Tax=Gigaspora margarita TaxID=4874 RepID=A0A8H4ATC0_GIGMA|nr:hypothetical protein F8M41_011998 [Gigaspora margarita]